MTSISGLPNFVAYQDRTTADTKSDTRSSGQQSGQVAGSQTTRAAATATMTLADEVNRITGDQSAMHSDFANLHLGTKLSTLA